MHNRERRVVAVIVLCIAASPMAACRRGTPDAKPSSSAAPAAQPLPQAAAAMPRSGAPTQATPGTSTPSAVPAATPQQPSGADATPLATQLTDLSKTLAPEDEILSEREKRLTTVDAAFAYVRDNIGFESYDGILRGADGTFHTRAGNALDRAMLLAAILESQKVPVRLVTGHLPPAAAERLFGRIFEQPLTTKTAAPRPMPAQATALKERILARAHHDYNVIVKALGAVPTAPMSSHDDLLKEIEAHAWVQAQVNGKWIDLDPSFPDSTMGHAYTAVEATYKGPPRTLMQQVTIRVIAEMLQGNTLTHDVAVETTVPAYQILDTQVYLAHTAPNLENVFGGADALRPVLFVNGGINVGNPINFAAGAAHSAGQPGPLGGVLSAFGAPDTGPAFVAEWLEFEIDFPGGRKDVSRRVLVDRASAGWRRARTNDASKLLPLARNAKGLVAAQTLYNIWFSAGRHDRLSFLESAPLMLAGAIPTADPAHPTFFEGVWPFAMRDLSWVMLSDHFIVPLLNDTPGLRFYADSPRIFIWSAGPDPAGDPNLAVMESDLRRDTLRGVARDPRLFTALSQYKLRFGALEAAMEHELGGPPLPDAGKAYLSTSNLTDGSDVVVVTAQTISKMPASDPETQSGMSAAVASGDTLVVPRRVLTGGTAGWWRISHESGDLRAVLGSDINASKGFTRLPIKKAPPGAGRMPGSLQPPIASKSGRGMEFREYDLSTIAAWIAEESYRVLALAVVDVVAWSAAAYLATHM